MFTFGNGGRVVLLSWLFLQCSIAAAATKPVDDDASDKTTAIMLDARVNLKDAFQRASDARPGAVQAGLQAAAAATRSIAQSVSQASRNVPGLQTSFSKVTGGPDSLIKNAGALTAAAPGRSNEEIVRGFLRGNGQIYGLSAADVDDLVVLGDSPGGTSGLRMLRIEQQIDGLPVFQSESRFLLDRDGRLIKSVGLMVPHARSLAPRVDPAVLLTPGQALAKLLATVGKVADPADFTAALDVNGRTQLTGGDGFVSGPVTARQVLFPLSPGVLVPAWSLAVFTTGPQDWYAIVDAETGDLLWRKGVRVYASAHDARFRVYVQADGTTPADSPAPMSPTTATPGSGLQGTAIAPTVVSMHAAMLAADPSGVASPNGWIDDCPGGVCTGNETQTLGNNVLACLDRVQGGDANKCDTSVTSVLDGNGRPTGNPDSNARNRDFLGTAPRDFETGFLPPPQAGNPESGQTSTGSGSSGTLAVDQFRRGSVTHLFYLSNWYHDKLFKLGFDEGAGNFQLANLAGAGGLGGDRVLADTQDGSGTNNANFSTFPDGTPGRMQMYVFTGPTIDRDGSLDAEIVLHELTHGTSTRLVGNAAGLNWDPANGMGEGWSDFYALSLLNNTNADDPNASYAEAGYASYKLIAGYTDNYLYGLRRFPYSTNHAVNPMTWADVDDVTNNLAGGIAPSPVDSNGNGGFEAHNSGEIWALTLWGVRARVIGNPAGANGDVPTGNHTTLQFVTDGLKMTPIDPTFIEGRDAILQADCATNACANEVSIWSGFADRGLGYGAAAPYKIIGRYFSGHEAIKESFAMPFLDVVNPLTDVTINDGAPNNANGAIDPGEAIKITVKLTNPWRGAGKAVTSAVATLTTSTAGITIYDNTSTYGAIAPQGTATGDTFMFTVAPSMTAGAPIDFTLSIVSNLGTTTTSLKLRVGTRLGTDPVVTYTRGPALGAVIVSNQPRGVFDQMTITDDFEIADVNFRVDSITHPGVGDLTVLLRSPQGIGTDLIAQIDGLNDPGGTTITNMVIDDDVPVTGANDMVQATTANAPYTKSWLPVFNSPWAALIDPANPADPNGNLNPYNGTSTKGVWSALVADNYSAAIGGTNGNGTFNGWSMLVTPVHFNISAVTPAVSITASKSVAGTFSPGGTVTYTVVLTNTGTGNQADNPGHEFTDTLAGSLTLVNATATSGTVTTAGNIVNWDGSLAPLGGSVTITITATINAGTGGTTIGNSGTVAFDADVNGTNESTKVTDDPAVGGATDPTFFTVASPPTILKAFGGATVALGSTTSLTFTISNPGGNVALTGIAFTDTLPGGLVVATPNNLGGTCNGTKTATAGSGSVSLSAATLGAGTSCTVTLNVTGTIAGSNPNSVTVSSTQGGAGNTSNATIVVVKPPTIAKAFLAASVPVGGSTTLTFNLGNAANAGVTLTGIGFTDPLPGGLVISTPNGLTGTCGGGTITAVQGTSTVTLAGASLADNGNCTFSVNVTVTANGAKNNVAGAVASVEGGTGLTASASLNGAGPPTIAKAFGAANIALGGSTSLTLTFGNPAGNPVTLTGVGATDTLPAGLVVATPNALASTCGGGTATATAGSNSVSLSGASIAAGATCTVTVNVTGTIAGAKINTTGAVTSTNGGTGLTATANVTVVAPPTIVKAFGAATIALNGSTSLTITMTNPNASGLTGVAFTDSLPAGLVVATPNGLANTCNGTPSAVAGSGSVSLTAGTVAGSSSCTVTVNVTGTTVGVKANTTGAVSSTEGGAGAFSNTATLGVVQTTFTGPTATGTGNATASFTTVGGGPNCTFTFAAFLPVSAVPESAPGQVTFPQGLFDFTVANCTPGFTMTLVVTYPQAIPQFAQYWKYGSTSGNVAPHWYVMPSGIVGNTATITITDSGLGDDDLATNGSITDQGGPGVSPPPAIIPTLQQSLIALLGLLSLLTGLAVIRRRRGK